jgi:hypothetical protein
MEIMKNLKMEFIALKTKLTEIDKKYGYDLGTAEYIYTVGIETSFHGSEEEAFYSLLLNNGSEEEYPIEMIDELDEL